MKILHTSDWHIGRSLYGRKRYDEFVSFLDWLAQLIETESVDALLVAGDIFDTNTPSNRAQELYYQFLCKVSSSCCRHIVVIAGNHDSPSFLNAPKALLRALSVHVIGSIAENPEDEVIMLTGSSDIPEAIVCAVPYLRDRDIRVVEAGESVEDKGTKLIEGVQKHYADVCKIAERKQKEILSDHKEDNLRQSAASADNIKIPIIAMGHLFTAGGKTMDGDGVRDLYVGTLAHVSESIFPNCIDYLALGHLHVPQKVGKSEHIRYSGSPIPMGYGEAKQEKKVILVEFVSRIPQISEHPVPCFQALERISGGMDEITERIHELKSQASCAWLEVEYTGTEIVGNLRELLDEAITGTGMEIHRIRNKRIVERVISRTSEDETLDDLDENDVFIRCLDTHEVSDDERSTLLQSYKEILQHLREGDQHAE